MSEPTDTPTAPTAPVAPAAPAAPKPPTAAKAKAKTPASAKTPATAKKKAAAKPASKPARKPSAPRATGMTQISISIEADLIPLIDAAADADNRNRSNWIGLTLRRLLTKDSK